tara:strand:- start:149 stop:430 length:282 start_codon:yes stop_codon:yes gene_type:complete
MYNTMPAKKHPQSRPGLQFIRPSDKTVGGTVEDTVEPVNSLESATTIPEYGQPVSIFNQHSPNDISFKYDMLCLLAVWVLFSWFISTIGVIKI